LDACQVEENSMSQDRSVQEYAVAAQELERAAAHYREAARHTELGEHVKAAHHAHIARGHFLNAQGFAHEAAKLHASRFSESVLAEHPVSESGPSAGEE
jgi:hypothetical protein